LPRRFLGFAMTSTNSILAAGGSDSGSIFSPAAS